MHGTKIGHETTSVERGGCFCNYATGTTSINRWLMAIPMVAKKIKSMKDNKSPGVDAIPPRLLMETEEQISVQLVIK